VGGKGKLQDNLNISFTVIYYKFVSIMVRTKVPFYLLFLVSLLPIKVKSCISGSDLS
jgi:hypothetical protein